ncbi:MAG TPA: PEP/pyruvate-binding domain-containing protein, partial [Nitrospira sp.]|nr:PEP/pyruvate-binding domain-containing protein [Nitrospira sp.]
MTSRFILPLHDCHDASLVGGKAVGLARLLASGIDVPEGFCLTTEAYRLALRALGFSATERWKQALGQVAESRRLVLVECQSMIRQVDISSLVKACAEEMQRIGGLERRWAVRSSASNEDTGQASFAGLYRTELGVLPTEIGRVIKELWASIWDERVVEYMTKAGPDDNPPA